ncbi:DUF6185 family protein [Actinacidiphila acidipaludis]|uniref:DUF6185 family protein n=1 Tax=Actinacidiphila acidipaludis TaxID=2873382 RepID=A0ABS7Q1Z0_9ACTN|nr:DUF6185 family protein [Streptomyces acidipaludis]MBY8876077.1 DUF6185 family protein [Streptomyces acidipaludis]
MIGLVVAALWILTGGQAFGSEQSAPPDVTCDSAGLSGVRLSGSLEFHHQRLDYTHVTTEVRVDVDNTWPFSADLLLRPGTPAYVHAMGCLLRGTGYAEADRPTEWRRASPTVLTRGRAGVSVDYQAEDWLNGDSDVDIGLWHLKLVGTTRWTAELVPPDTLRGGVWTSVRVDLGGPRPDYARPRPSSVTDRDTMGWSWAGPLSGSRAVEPVSLGFRPPRAQAYAAAGSSDDMQYIEGAAGALWDVAALGVVAFALWPLRRRTPGNHPAMTDGQRTAVTVTRQWAILVAVAAVFVYLSHPLSLVAQNYLPDGNDARGVQRWVWVWSSEEARWTALQAAVLGLALCLFGRPRRSVLIAAAVTAVGVAAVAVRPSLAGLSPDFSLPDGAGEDPAIAWLLAVDAGTVFLWLMALTACIQRVWCAARVEGLEWRNRKRMATGLPVPTSAAEEARNRRFRLRGTGLAFLAVAGVVALWAWVVAEWNWRRLAWLDDTSAADYGQRHAQQVIGDMGWFAWDCQDWLFGNDWIVTGLALAAVLAVFGTPVDADDATATAPAPPSAPNPGLPATAEQPWPLTRVAVAFGAVTFVSYFGPYLGIPLGWVSLLLAAGVLSLLLAWGRKRAVLCTPLQPRGPRVVNVIRESDRRRWLEAARSHLELQQELGRLDRDGSENALERKRRVQELITRRHRWNVGSRYPRPALRLPPGVTPVDVALAWGPRPTWLGNALYAARVAAVAGIPGTLLVLTVANTDASAWSSLLGTRFQLPEIPIDFIAWEFTWASVGFFFGAMHRALPGRRGYTRALAMWLALLLPVVADSCITYVLAEDPDRSWLLSVAALLPILTVTGMAMDRETFKRDRPYWRSTPGLLLSVYQLRSTSVQAAFALAQVAAVVGLWQQLKGGGSPPTPPSPN